MIIFGIKSYTRLLATLSLVCPSCHQRAAHRLFEVVRKFTLFFIPLIPVGTSRRMDCINCGYASKVSKDQAEQLITSAPRPTAG
ncbi:zinc-ribbon domain-containing protein [Nocardioides panzhihuensis]|uniref:Zn ribbon nucleic-acid-binding protein n=1 Tax=Nocardioides panzhihuensis TaxID=860243 RepID=A0A7Z0DMQ4_9ACTN|nr:zinc-ribbon domain-containing protein [Nocardioides panzhihuensis]NYI78490.1 Zn ribbon nucleic-acid-binding protein [Nocardioides panzhihuensis]